MSDSELGRPMVLVLGSPVGRLEDRQIDQIVNAARGMQVVHVDRPEELDALIGEAVILAVTPHRITGSRLRRAGRLRWAHLWTAGVDGAMVDEAVESPILFTSSKGNGAVPLAEQAMLLMLMLNRNAVRWVDAQREHRWDQFMHPELAGLTCGIVGLGNSGLEVARRAKAFDMRVLGLRRHYQPTPFVDEVLPREALHDLLRRSDVVVVTAPRTPETTGMFGEAEFRAMKPSATFICFSRGGIAQDEALLRALHEGWIAGAGLDVHGQEPLPPDSAFWTAPNTIVTPHNGAVTPQTKQRAVDIFVDNLKRFSLGEPLINLVDKRLGY